jgi:Tfp pilus assembly protein PilO
MTPLQKIVRTYQGLITAIVMVLFSIVGIIFGIVPAVGKVNDIRNEMITLATTTQQLQTKIDILNSTDESVYRAQLQELIAAVPSDKSLTTLFSTIDAVGVSSGVTLTDLSLVKPGSIATESAVKQSNEEKQIGSNLLPFSVTVNGSYTQIYNFLGQIINVRRFFRVRNFTISFVDMTNISVRMDMDAFYAPISLNPALFDKPLDSITKDEEDTIAKISAYPIVGQISLPAVSTVQPSVSSGRSDPFNP